MNNLIYQCHIVGPRRTHQHERHDHIKYSLDHFCKYAKIHGVEYLFSRDRYMDYTRPYGFNATYEKLRPILDTTFDDYDNILVVDTDVLIAEPNNNIFDVSFDNIAMVRDNNISMFEQVDHYNSGVVLTTKEFRQSYREYFKEYKPFIEHIVDNEIDARLGSDEYFINKVLRENNVEVHQLADAWNIWYRYRGDKEYNFLHFCNSDKRHMKRLYKALQSRWM